MKFLHLLIFGGLMLLTLCVKATTHYVDASSVSPLAPYTNWSTAAIIIQDAVDASTNGDLVLVTNGIYATGGRKWFDSGTNRVTLTNAVTLQSVNGPTVTWIVGNQVVGTGLILTNTARCVGMGNGAILSGFTLTNGEAGAGNYPAGGGVAILKSGASIVTNCILVNNLATNSSGGGAYRVTLIDCQIRKNSAQTGGGVTACTLIRCTFSGNIASSGGAAYGSILDGACVLSNCTLTGNSAISGGGAYGVTLNNCSISNNTAGSGGGIYGGTAINCLIISNSAVTGGGVYSSSLNNCLVVNNRAGDGGGIYGGVITNCTVILNNATNSGGGVAGGTGAWLYNSIVYYNTAPTGSNNIGAKFNNSCTLPNLAGSGITNAPLLVDLTGGNYHLQSSSPCINAGNNTYVTTATDLDGYPRLVGGTADIGAYEFQSPIKFVNVSNPAPVPPYTSWATAATNIQDAVNASTNGDLVLVTNGFYAFGGKDVYGSNRVAVTTAITVQSLNGPAATVIAGVTNGGNVRCAFLTNGAVLVGFTLTNGASGGNSGGVFSFASNSSTISNCVIVGNSAPSGGGAVNGVFYKCTIKGNYGNNGGGVSGSILYNCLVSSNTAGNGGGCASGTAYGCRFIGNTAGNGGGSYSSSLQNCLLTGNLATGSFGGGGAYQGTLENCTVVANRCQSAGGNGGGTPNVGGCISCIIYNNTSLSSAGTQNYSGGGFLYNCCTTPLPSGGPGNFTTDPLLVNQAGGDFHLQSTSPCINAGNNIYATSATDLDGNPRIVDGTVDVGAYEYQTPASAISYAWEQQYGLPTDGTADNADADGDGMSNFAEWKAGTIPTDSTSVLKVASPTNSVSGVVVTWQSVSGVTYYLQRSGDLTGGFSSIVSNLTGQAGNTSYTDTTATNSGPYFFRIGVQ